ncbi:RsiV family protein [uncultured Algibacter sp.]|uniref:RsiV family protein n=1 Tax=uncultured Algibacter sp. TaxID=298659 RepID=UPI003217DBC3
MSLYKKMNLDFKEHFLGYSALAIINMKYLITSIVITLFFNCKNDVKNKTFDGQENIVVTSIDSLQTKELDIPLNKSIAIENKQQALIKKKDEREQLEELLIEKKYIKDVKDFSINFTYPLLNVKLNPKYSYFNEYMNDYYIDVIRTEADILESKLLCDSIKCLKFRETRYIDYKVYNVNDQLISLLFYKENMYSGAMHPTYTFNCINYDLNRNIFMSYEDFFIKGTEEQLTVIINEKINEKLKDGELYYDCWQISQDDFFANKNNFVLNETYVEFYFDDCIICPSYTGSYSIEIPLVELLAVLKKYDLNPLVF